MFMPAGCSAGPLEPMAQSLEACNVSVVATQSDFDQGYLQYTIQGTAQPRTASGLVFPWSYPSVTHQLTRIGRVAITTEHFPSSVSAGSNLTLVYHVTNTGNIPLHNTSVVSSLGKLSCGGSDGNGTSIDVDDMLTCRCVHGRATGNV